MHIQIQRNKIMYDMNNLILKDCMAMSDALSKIAKTDCEKDFSTNEICRNWNFTLPNKDLLCYEEIVSSISRKNPIAIIFESVGDEKHITCLTHHSLIAKAKNINHMPIKFSLSEFKGIYIIRDTHIKPKDFISWAKYVKNAKWKLSKKSTIRVIIPKI
jgi:hypothetical protein